MRLKTLTFIKLERRVARFVQRCAWCNHLVIPLDAVYVPCVGDRALTRACSQRCAAYEFKQYVADRRRWVESRVFTEMVPE